MKDTLIILLLVVCAAQIYVIAQLAPDEPKQECIPLYGQTGYECCQK